jgi:hypothetical protein
MADQVGRLLDPYQIAPLFVRLPSSNTPTLAPLPLTHHQQRLHHLAWYDSTGEAKTGPIFKCREIVNFAVSAYRRDRRPHRLIKIRSNDTDLGRQANLKESSESKELAELRLQVLVVVIANVACESKKGNYET